MTGRGRGLCRADQLTKQVYEVDEELKSIVQDAPEEIKQRLAPLRDKVGSLKAAFEQSAQLPLTLGRGRGGAGRGLGRGRRRR